jgi:hypothetical protein
MAYLRVCRTQIQHKNKAINTKNTIYNTNFNDNKKNVTKLRKKVPIYLAANK